MIQSGVHADSAGLPTEAARPKSDVTDVVWPLLLSGDAAMMEVFQVQFRESERASPRAVQIQQELQIVRLAAHARNQSQFWRSRLDAVGFGTRPTFTDWFHALPILTRKEAKLAGNGLFAIPVPPSHGGIHQSKTSGSTGTPLEIAKTDLAQIFWMAITLRDSLWHRRNLKGKLAVIRVGSGRGESPRWSPAYAGYENGPAVAFDARESVDLQLDWLVGQQPQILLSHASNLRELARRSVERGERLTQLREVRSFSERLPDDLRDWVRQAWNVPLTDMYSSNEVGYVALQCPVSGKYHVQSEDVMVEIIDDTGRHCSPGETGRVIVTSLHNFAMPLIRYDLGDYATVGSPCSCGRTLPVIERIDGRVRNMMRLPGGRTAWPGFPMNTLIKLDAIQEFRMIQHSLEEIEVELVLRRPLTPAEQGTLTAAIQKRLNHPFEIRLTPVERIERGSGHKREDFECRMT